MTWSTIARPQIMWRGLGRADRMRVPSPAASTIAETVIADGFRTVEEICTDDVRANATQTDALAEVCRAWEEEALAAEELDPYPLLPGLQLHVAAVLAPENGDEAEPKVVDIPVPSQFQRFIRIPADEGTHLACLEDVIAAYERQAAHAVHSLCRETLRLCARHRQTAMESDHGIQQPVDRLAFAPEIDPQITGKEQVGLTGLDRDAGRNTAAIKIPAIGRHIVLSDHTGAGHRARLALDRHDAVDQHQGVVGQAHPDPIRVDFVESRTQHAADAADGKLHAHVPTERRFRRFFYFFYFFFSFSFLLLSATGKNFSPCFFLFSIILFSIFATSFFLNVNLLLTMYTYYH